MFKRLFIISVLILSIITIISCYDIIASTVYDYQFSDVYQKPWYQNKLVVWGGILLSALIVGAITYFTAGTGTAAAAGPIASWIGSALGSLAGFSGIVATNWGLAAIGFGALASNGLGILGGVAILNGIGDLALGTAIHLITESRPSNDTRPAFERTISLPTRVGTPNNKKIVETINDLLEPTENTYENEANMKKAAHLVNSLADQTFSYYTINKDFDDMRFDVLTSAIASFNIGNFEDAQNKLNILLSSANRKKMGFLYYFSAFLNLADGDTKAATSALITAINSDNDAIPAYLLLAQLYKDNDKLGLAIDILEKARKDSDDDNYAVNYFLASLYFQRKQYNKAIEMYKEALSDITINSYEAECKMNIAICYYKLNDYKNSNEWKKDAYSEVDDDREMQKYISELFEAATTTKSLPEKTPTATTRENDDKQIIHDTALKIAQDYYYEGVRAYNSGDLRKAKELLQLSCDSGVFNSACTYLADHFNEDTKVNPSQYTHESAQEDFFIGVRAYNSGDIEKAKTYLKRSCESKLYDRSCTYLKKYFSVEGNENKSATPINGSNVSSGSTQPNTYTKSLAEQDFFDGVRSYNSGDLKKAKMLLYRSCESKLYDRSCTYFNKYFANENVDNKSEPPLNGSVISPSSSQLNSYTKDIAEKDFFDAIRLYNSGEFEKAKELLEYSCNSKLYDRSCTYLEKYFDITKPEPQPRNEQKGQEFFYSGIREFNSGNKTRSLELLNKACKDMGFNPACLYIKNNF